MSTRWPLLCGAVVSGAVSAAQPGATSGEAEYFADLPVVLTVSRLAQPLNETPGAVTVIDRDMIRMSGVRNVAELMRFVPGFQVSDSVEALAPLVSYHGGFTGFPNQMQVLVDGRSVYGSFAVGTVAPGLQTVDLDDIERIEVLRGSNSAAYGARAFLGVINIITRDALATRGVRVAARYGENGVSDGFARVGWKSESGEYRISAGHRREDGMVGSAGPDSVDNMNFRGDFHISPRDELQLRAGASRQDSRVGKPGSVGDLPRDRQVEMGYVQADWRRTLSGDADLLVNFAHGEERYRDVFPYGGTSLPGFFGVPIDFGGKATNDTLGIQHTFRMGQDTRVVWGGELRREEFRSPPLYNTEDSLATVFRRLYGNVEQRLVQNVVVNAGGMYEDNNLSGSSFAPRVMLNWHVVRDHTLRFGVSKAYRPPSTYEARADQVFVGAPTLGGIYGVSPPLVPITPRLQLISSSGTLRPEELLAREIGYLGEFRPLGLTADVRIFDERLRNGIGKQAAATSTSYPAILATAQPTQAYTNKFDFPIHGFEAQLQYRPRPGTRLIYSHATIRINSDENAVSSSAPREADAISWFQELPGGLDLSVMHFQSSSPPWASASGSPPPPMPAWHRLDLRLGKRFQVGATRGEAAVVVQNLGSGYQDYPSVFKFSNGSVVCNPNYRFEQRTFVTVSFDL